MDNNHIDALRESAYAAAEVRKAAWAKLETVDNDDETAVIAALKSYEEARDKCNSIATAWHNAVIEQRDARLREQWNNNINSNSNA